MRLGIPPVGSKDPVGFLFFFFKFKKKKIVRGCVALVGFYFL